MVSETSHIQLRNCVWRVVSRQILDHGREHFGLLDPETGEKLNALCPPDTYVALPDTPPVFERGALSPWRTWYNRHEALRLAAWPANEYAALHAGRISPEPYQFAPAARMLRLPRPNLLIADDVGLGKTIEAGICMLELIARGRGRRILLIVPPALIPQWQSEMLEKFQLSFEALENAAAVEQAQTRLAEGIRPWVFMDRVITSIEYIKKREVARSALEHPWDLIVVDEAHYLADSGTPANPYTTARGRLGRMLRDRCRALLLLTATPHNGYRHSFRSLLEIVEPADAALMGAEETVRRRVARNMIRRLKSQITVTGPDGQTRPAFPPREPVRPIEVNLVFPEDAEILRKVSSYCARTAKASQGTDEQDLVSFAMQIVKKRMLSSRAALAKTIARRLDALKGRGETEPPPTRAELREAQGDLPLSEAAVERIEERVLRAAISRDARRRKTEQQQLHAIHQLLKKAADRPDPKLSRLIADIEAEVLPVSGEKAIVFTEYRDTLDALRAALDAHPRLAGRHAELTGGLSAKQRADRIAQFQSPECVLLLATDAASEGLNLQRHCRRVYHLELPWNPNRMEQRNGRVDRHGQTRPPIIKYLYYPDSPEDRILDALARKLATMRDDRVSTPDLLGISAEARIEDALAELDAEQPDDTIARRLFERLDNGKESFVREMGVIFSAGGRYRAELDPESLSADPVMADDLDLEQFLKEQLGTRLEATPIAHVYKLRPPRELLGPGVREEYPALTFRRTVAIEYPARDVEFIHRLHPLFQAVVAAARRALTFAAVSNTGGARLAARRWSGARATGPFALFTFLDDSGDRPEVLAVAVTPETRCLPADWAELRLMAGEPPDEVGWREVERIFGGPFASMQATAQDQARSRQAQRLERLSRERAEMGRLLREDAEQYRTDRLREIDEEERAQRYGAQVDLPLFRNAPTGFAARRAGVETHYRKRMEEIEAFERVTARGEPQPLGVLFVLPPES